MKIASLRLLLIFITIKISANENWIKIEPINKTQTSKSNTKVDIDLSQIEPINKMMKNATVIKQLIDATSKKDEPTSNEKNWFVLNAEDSQ
ncbi:MAG: hypothetical protein COB17_06770 [Sulfurimonas sp.]|nr:MAG: hypothetical protein COB17_06770 [Sulfurimonas sp.]